MKENLDDINNDLLVKFLLGETNPQENILVKHWINSEEGHSKYFDHFKLIWEQSKQLAVFRTVDEDAAWRRFQNRIHPGLPNTVRQLKPTYRQSFIRLAAIFIMVVAGTWLAYNFLDNRPVRQLVFNTGQTSVTDTLSDGSIVILNTNSQLQYPEYFQGGKRSVILKGEAFFNISPDKSKPFVIQVNDVSIKVVGTSFNVKSTGDKTEVIVETGLVEVTKESQSVRLKPSEKIVIQKSDLLLVKLPVTDKLYNYYRTKEFYCDATPLWKLAEVLNQAYTTRIVIPDKNTRRLPLTTVFEDQPLDSILAVIKTTFNLSVVKSGDSIIIK